MFKRIIQPGLLCIFDADHGNPLKLWNKVVKDGKIKRIISIDVKGLVLEISGKHALTSCITCPAILNETLAIQYPFFHAIIKLMDSTFFGIVIQVLDNKSVKRRFRISTAETFVEIHPFLCKLPLTLESGWNHVTIPLHHFLKDVYGTGYVHTLRVAVYPNCLLKKIYFSDKQYLDEEIPSNLNIEDIEPSENESHNYTSRAVPKKRNV